MTVKSTQIIMDDDSIAHCPAAFVEPRHSETIEGENVQAETWRMKERMKTVSVALVMCLNIGVDPPDVVKPQPCARLECWLDPLGISQQKALETIGTALQKLYERWQPRARYKQSLDPTVEDVKKLCTSLRRNAKDERVLFHYNGHGVPKPTKNGEIWVFNKSYTQYIPLSIFDLQTWMGAPSIFVWDCNCAGQIVESFKQFGEQHEKEYNSTLEYHRQHSGIGNAIHHDSRKSSIDGIQAMANHSQPNEETDEYPGCSTAPNFRECIQLGACRLDQILPTNAELPADLFTSSLTTPIKVAVMWYILQNNLTDKIPLDIIDKIPGQLSDRRTLLGELNWIFTAITDTIAWHVLPRELFQKLFRQDLLVASLFRNFLLADRVMRSYNCSPVSHPELPPTHEHPMWQAWDFALDVCLSQLLHATSIVTDIATPVATQQSISASSITSVSTVDPNAAEYTHSPFFAIQLTAFEVWLQYGYNRREPPLQLPIVLQVLLSQVHRIRALELLGRFLDLGSWAVSLALSVGIFPYVLKLLQSSAKELRPLLSFIWAKILAVDSACQQDLIKDGGHRYFLQILSDPSVVDEQKIVSAFVLASILDNYTAGQEAIMQGGFISICLDLLTDCKCSMLRRWLTVGLGRLWSDFDAARWQGIRCCAYEKLYELLDDPVPEVRAGAVYALGTLISNRSEQNEHATLTDHMIAAVLVQKVCSDGSPLVRQELIIALHWLILNFENQFITLAYELNEENLRATEKHLLFNHQQQKVKQINEDRRNNKLNGEIPMIASSPDYNKRHPRQSSLSIADNLCTATLIANTGDLSTASSTHNLSTLAPPAAPKLASVASFSKMLGLIAGGATNAATIKQTASLVTTSRDEFFAAKLTKSTVWSSSAFSTSPGNIYITVWRTVLHFLEDPDPGVVELVNKLIEHIKKEVVQLYMNKMEDDVEGGASANPTENKTILSLSKQTANQKVLDESPGSASRATFVIGSPADQSASFAHGQSPTTSANAPVRRTRLLTPRIGDDGQGPTLSIYSTIYSPRRGVFKSGPSNGADEEPPGSKKTGRKPALIETKFLPWCCRRFTEPVLHLFDEETGKISNIECTKELPLTDWALETSMAMTEFSEKERRSLKKSARLDKQIFVNQNNYTPLCLEFYPLHPLMCVGEQKNVSVWNWELGHFVNSMENHTSDGSGEISFVKVINPLTHGFLMTGTSCGEVRVWDFNLSSYYDWRQPSSYNCAANKAKLLTAWNSRGNDITKGYPLTSTIYCWEQESALLLVGGDSKLIRIWDAHTELKMQDIQLNNLDGIVKSISSDTNGNNMIAVGCSDGTVRLFDRRLPTNECNFMTLRDLHSNVLKVFLQPKSIGSHVVAGNVDGNVCIWDPRMFRDPISLFKVCETNVTTMDVHSSLELISCATTNHKVFTTNFCGQSMGVIQYHDGFMGQRLVEINCLKFHPYRINLAVGSIDCILSMYGL